MEIPSDGGFESSLPATGVTGVGAGAGAGAGAAMAAPAIGLGGWGSREKEKENGWVSSLEREREGMKFEMCRDDSLQRRRHLVLTEREGFYGLRVMARVRI